MSLAGLGRGVGNGSGHPASHPAALFSGARGTSANWHGVGMQPGCFVLEPGKRGKKKAGGSSFGVGVQLCKIPLLKKTPA